MSWPLPQQWPEPLPLPVTDSHAHLSDLAFSADRATVVKRALRLGVVRILDPGVDLATSAQALSNARDFFPHVAAAVGVHPHHVAEMGAQDWRDLEELARDPMVVALGEIGLDRVRSTSPWEVQVRALERQLEMAQRLGRPVLLHCRGAYAEMLEILGPRPPVSGILHAFWADRAVAEAFLERGFCLGVGGAVTFSRESHLRQTLSSLPPGSLVLETDAPYLAPEPQRGRRCESALVAYTARYLAQVRGEPVELLLEHVEDTFRRHVPWPQEKDSAIPI